MIIEHMRKASLELADHIAQFNYDQRPLSVDFINGFFFYNRLYYVFRVNLREYLPELLGVVGGYSSFDPMEKAKICNAQYNFDLELVQPLIRVLTCNLKEIKQHALMYYHATQKLEIVGPDNRQLITNYHFEPSLSLDIETNSPSPDYAFASHILDYPKILPAPIYEDLSKLVMAKFSFSHVLLKTASFSVEDFIDCFEELWSERLRPDNYNIKPRRLQARLPPEGTYKKQNKHFNFQVDNDLTLSININQSAKFIKEYARKYKGSLLEPNLKDFASKTHKTLQISCTSRKGTLIEATRFLVKAVTACCNLFNAQAVVTNNFVYKANLYKETALQSLDASIDYFSWFPTFNILGNKVMLLHNHEKLCAGTEGMNRFNLLDIFIPECDLQATDLVNVLNTLARASFDHKGDIANRRFHIKSLNCVVMTSVKRSARTNKRYLMAKIFSKDKPLTPEDLMDVKFHRPLTSYRKKHS